MKIERGVWDLESGYKVAHHDYMRKNYQNNAKKRFGAIQLHHDESPWAASWCLLNLPAPECSILTSRTLSCWCLLTLPAPECSIFCKQLLLKQNNPGFLYSLLGFTISCRFNIQIRMPFLCILNYPCFSLLWLVISNVPADSRFYSQWWAFKQVCSGKARDHL